MTKLVNFLLYQIGWFACVLGAAWQVPGPGTALAICLLATHLALATDRLTQLKLVMLSVVIGLALDTALLKAGVFVFPHGGPVKWLPPPWMPVLWMQFATTFQYSMRWLSRRYLLCAGFGFLGAPLAFFAGARLGAIEFLQPRWASYLILAICWSLAVPLLVYASDFLAARSRHEASYRRFSLLKRRSI